MGYARAQRDLSCVYSVGFYDDDPVEDKARGVQVRVRRSGYRTMHPSRYVFRSDSEKRRSLVRAAFAAPDMFQTGLVRAHIYPLRPRSKKTWDGWLAVSFPVSLAETAGEPARRDFGAILTTGNRRVHSFHRRVTLLPDDPGVTSEPSITFLEPVALAPGQYTMSAVMSLPDGTEVHAAKVALDVPEIPHKELFLAGPILGRRAGSNLVIMSGGAAENGDEIRDPNSFQPLLLHQIEEPIDIVGLTQACVVGKKKYGKKRSRDVTIERALYDDRGERRGELDPVGLQLESADEGNRDRVLCQNLVDVLPASSLAGGSYTFEALVDGDRDDGDRARVRFAVTPEPSPVAGTRSSD